MAKVIVAKASPNTAALIPDAQTIGTDIPQAGAAPTQAQFNLLVDRVNDLAQILRNSGASV